MAALVAVVWFWRGTWKSKQVTQDEQLQDQVIEESIIEEGLE